MSSRVGSPDEPLTLACSNGLSPRQRQLNFDTQLTSFSAHKASHWNMLVSYIVNRHPAHEIQLDTCFGETRLSNWNVIAPPPETMATHSVQQRLRYNRTSLSSLRSHRITEIHYVESSVSLLTLRLFSSRCLTIGAALLVAAGRLWSAMAMRRQVPPINISGTR